MNNHYYQINSFIMLKKPFSLNYISPECRVIETRTSEIICTSVLLLNITEGATLDGFEIETDDSFLD